MTLLVVERRHPEVVFGFLTALVDEELLPVERQLEAMGWLREPLTEIDEKSGVARWSKAFDGLKIRVVTGTINGMGQAESAIETFVFLQRFKPACVFLVGIAGSLNATNYMRGDVVVGSRVFWSSKNKVKEDKGVLTYRDNTYLTWDMETDHSKTLKRFLSERFANAKNSSEMRDHVFFEPIFTWDMVVSSEVVVAEILDRWPRASCVEMEAGGFLKAVARFNGVRSGRGPRPVVVRGISDYAAFKKDDDDVRRRASMKAAEVAIATAEWMLNSNNRDHELKPYLEVRQRQMFPPRERA